MGDGTSGEKVGKHVAKYEKLENCTALVSFISHFFDSIILFLNVHLSWLHQGCSEASARDSPLTTTKSTWYKKVQELNQNAPEMSLFPHKRESDKYCRNTCGAHTLYWDDGWFIYLFQYCLLLWWLTRIPPAIVLHIIFHLRTGDTICLSNMCSSMNYGPSPKKCSLVNVEHLVIWPTQFYSPLLHSFQQLVRFVWSTLVLTTMMTVSVKKGERQDKLGGAPSINHRLTGPSTAGVEPPHTVNPNK